MPTAMDLLSIFEDLGIALGLGLLVGLQRETQASRLAGFRTFPLVTILGTITALLAQNLGGWVVAAGLLALAGLIILGNVAEIRSGFSDPGITTEVAIVLMYVVGAYLVVGPREVAVAVGGGMAVLLHWKAPLHRLAARLGQEDLQAIMKFALISLVILPVLPDKTYGPYNVLNPHQIWWMVVLIVGISLGGYIIYKFWGEKAGIVLGGILGGLISSTATTVSYARRTAHAAALHRGAALVLLIASTVVFMRVLVEIAVVAPGFLLSAAPPLLIVAALLAVAAAVLWSRGPQEQSSMPAQENPTEFKSALFFGLLFALVLLAVAAARDILGQRGLYAVAALSGLTDMDAITLSTAQLVSSDRLDGGTGWRLIMLASLSNLAFKAGTVAVLGHRHLLARIAPIYGLAAAVGVLLILVWP